MWKNSAKGIYVIGIIQFLLFGKVCPGTGPGPRFAGGTVSGKTEGKGNGGEKGRGRKQNAERKTEKPEESEIAEGWKMSGREQQVESEGTGRYWNGRNGKSGRKNPAAPPL